MRSAKAIATAIVLLALIQPAFAEDDESESSSESSEESKTIDFKPKKIDGNRKIPQVERVKGAGDADFDKVRNIDKKSFMGGGDSSESSEESNESEQSEESEESED